ncbi:MAG: hypothetical protein ACOC1O_04450 [bacterium]
MSNLKLGLYLTVKVLTITAYIMTILYTAVNGLWIVTGLTILIPLSSYYTEKFLKVVRIRKKFRQSEEKVSELQEIIRKSKEKMENRDDVDE